MIRNFIDNLWKQIKFHLNSNPVAAGCTDIVVTTGLYERQNAYNYVHGSQRHEYFNDPLVLADSYVNGLNEQYSSSRRV